MNQDWMNETEIDEPFRAASCPSAGVVSRCLRQLEAHAVDRRDSEAKKFRASELKGKAFTRSGQAQ